jgi:hypothetical protein
VLKALQVLHQLLQVQLVFKALQVLHQLSQAQLDPQVQ